MKLKSLRHLLMLLPFVVFSNQQNYEYSNTLENYFLVSGRVDVFSKSMCGLISSASSVTFSFKGKSASYSLKSVDSWEHHNYFCLVVDGDYKGRFKIQSGLPQVFSVSSEEDKIHTVSIYKATEAASGTIVFDGSEIQGLVPTKPKELKKIEFIGDSITCGAQSDPSEVPCNQGEYFDQHNAYFAYGPILSRNLKLDFMLSSVSGIGMYRNWNDENTIEPIMPQVYENLYLNNNSNKVFEANYQPDFVSICLGTNDMSNGDGQKPRKPFDAEKFTASYISFVQKIFRLYPNTKLILLSSPMLSSEQNSILVSCLKNVIKAFNNDKTHKSIVMFEFSHRKANGCTGHPNLEDHTSIALELESFFSELLNEK